MLYNSRDKSTKMIASDFLLRSSKDIDSDRVQSIDLDQGTQ